MMKPYDSIPVLLLLITISLPVFGQISPDSYTHHSSKFHLYSFEMGGLTKVKYFTHNANYYYQLWQSDKNVDVICAGAFSESWASDSKPVGFTINNGTPVNYAIDSEMDALVMVQNTHIEVLDLDQLEDGIKVDGDVLSLNPRKSALHRRVIVDAAKEASFSVFQTQLLYSSQRNRNFQNLYYGDEAERRFLAVCTKDNEYFNIIVDIPSELYLNLAAKYAKEVLDYADYSVNYIINLDTGGKNIFYKRSSSTHITKMYNEGLDEATNLIIFYRE